MCLEARKRPVKPFRTAFLLASTMSRQENEIGACTAFSGTIFNAWVTPRRRCVSCIAPEHDTVAVHGQDTYSKLSKMLNWSPGIDQKR